MNRELDCAEFSADTLAWFREGDEMGARDDHRFVTYESEPNPLRSLIGRSGIAFGSVALGVMALGWLVTQLGA